MRQRQRPGVRRMQQGQLAYLLVGGEQVAFDMIGEKLQCVGFGRQTLLAQSLRQPAGQGGAGRRGKLDAGRGCADRLEPGALAVGPVHGRQLDDGQRVRRQLRDMTLQRLAAVLAGFAGGDRQLDQAAAGEQ